MQVTLFRQVSHGGLLCFCQLVLFPNSVTDLIQRGCRTQNGWLTKEATEKIERSQEGRRVKRQRDKREQRTQKKHGDQPRNHLQRRLRNQLYASERCRSKESLAGGAG
jgi:hypothetical protein